MRDQFLFTGFNSTNGCHEIQIVFKLYLKQYVIKLFEQLLRYSLIKLSNYIDKLFLSSNRNPSSIEEYSIDSLISALLLDNHQVLVVEF